MARRRLLTKTREQWVANRTVALKGGALRLPVTTPDRYAKDLNKLVQQMIRETEVAIHGLLASDASRRYFGMDASIASQARIILDRLDRRFAKLFREKAAFSVRSMVNNASKASKSTLHASMKQLSGGLSLKTDILTGELKEVVKATVAENVGLIKTVPEQYLGQVRGAMLRSITQSSNTGLAGVQQQIDAVLNSRAKQIRNKARNVALDQTRKAYNNINRGRMLALGITKFEWVHSGGPQKPRRLHQVKLNGNIYSFDDLPIIEEGTGERGIPGQAINCQCTMAPVIEFENGR